MESIKEKQFNKNLRAREIIKCSMFFSIIFLIVTAIISGKFDLYSYSVVVIFIVVFGIIFVGGFFSLLYLSIKADMLKTEIKEEAKNNILFEENEVPEIPEPNIPEPTLIDQPTEENDKTNNLKRASTAFGAVGLLFIIIFSIYIFELGGYQGGWKELVPVLIHYAVGVLLLAIGMFLDGNVLKKDAKDNVIEEENKIDNINEN